MHVTQPLLQRYIAVPLTLYSREVQLHPLVCGLTVSARYSKLLNDKPAMPNGPWLSSCASSLPCTTSDQRASGSYTQRTSSSCLQQPDSGHVRPHLATCYAPSPLRPASAADQVCTRRTPVLTSPLPIHALQTASRVLSCQVSCPVSLFLPQAHAPYAASCSCKIPSSWPLSWTAIKHFPSSIKRDGMNVQGLGYRHT